MKERLTHKMEIEELHLTAQALGKAVKLLGRETALDTLGLRTEDAVKVTDVRYFQITAGYHTQSYYTERKYNILQQA